MCIINCAICGDTGVIETGNNDLPCTCAAGDAAKFNVCVKGGVKEFSGAQLKRREDMRSSHLPSTTAPAPYTLRRQANG